jgi:hypothetical protein
MTTHFIRLHSTNRRGCRIEEDTEVSLDEEILDSRNEVDRLTIDSLLFLSFQ